LAWTYLPNALLVLMSYAIQGVDSSIQSLQPYLALERGLAKGRESLLFNPANHSIFSVSYRALRQGNSWIVFGSTLTCLIFPAIKIIASGLYIHELITRSS